MSLVCAQWDDWKARHIFLQVPTVWWLGTEARTGEPVNPGCPWGLTLLMAPNRTSQWAVSSPGEPGTHQSQLSRSRPLGPERLRTLPASRHDNAAWERGGMGVAPRWPQAVGMDGTLSVPGGFPPPFAPQPCTPAQTSLFAKRKWLLQRLPIPVEVFWVFMGETRQNEGDSPSSTPWFIPSHRMKRRLAADQSKSRLWPSRISGPRTRRTGSRTASGVWRQKCAVGTSP